MSPGRGRSDPEPVRRGKRDRSVPISPPTEALGQRFGDGLGSGGADPGGQ